MRMSAKAEYAVRAMTQLASVPVGHLVKTDELAKSQGIPPQFLIAMFPSVNGYFFVPTYGSLIAAINFDLAGTTKIGRYVLNHSFMIPGLVATSVAVVSGLLLARVLF